MNSRKNASNHANNREIRLRISQGKCHVHRPNDKDWRELAFEADTDPTIEIVTEVRNMDESR